jgi:hypothetical protein
MGKDNCAIPTLLPVNSSLLYAPMSSIPYCGLFWGSKNPLTRGRRRYYSLNTRPYVFYSVLQPFLGLPSRYLLSLNTLSRAIFGVRAILDVCYIGRPLS